MRTISIINLKGGVGKTTTAVTIAQLLAEGDRKRQRPGFRVLLVDNDKQGNSSRLLGVYEREGEAGACRMLRTGSINGAVRNTQIPRLDVVPCNYFMELAEMEIKADRLHKQHDRYRSALKEIAEEYDYCIIDNPPDLGLNVVNALAATDEIIIPVWLDAYSLDGLEELTFQIEQIKKLNPRARLAGCLITDFERTDTSEAAELWLRSKSGLPVFGQKIRHSKKAKDATIYKQTPCQYSIRSGAAQDYKKLVAEYLERYRGERKEANGI